MKFFLDGGNLCIEYKNQIISNITMALECAGTKFNLVDFDSGAWETDGAFAYAKTAQGGRFCVQAKEHACGMLLSCGYESGERETVERVLRIRLRGYLPHNPSVVVGNENPHEPGGNRCLYDMCGKATTTGLIGEQEFFACDYIAYKTAQNNYGVLGAVTFDKYFTTVSVSANGMFSAYVNVNEHWRDKAAFTIQPNMEIKSDELLLTWQDTDALPTYGKVMADINGVKKKFDVPFGWCSWYYYLGNISEKIILENLNTAYENKLPFKYIQIDDGWAKNRGDWEANERFPSGMKALADEIKAKGFIPGIWVAPFLFDKESKVYKENPDWFLEEKNVVKGVAFVDYGNDGAREYLYNLFRKLSVEWGYRYIKVDLISWAIALKGYSKPNFNGLNNFREALKIMRSAVTEDTLILTCTAPIGPSVKYADATRISIDIFERWDSLKEVARQVVKRTYAHEYLMIDPDCIMLRNAQKEDEECGRLCVRNEREIETFMTLMSITGGAIMSSDKLSLLNETDFDKLRALSPMNTTPATALDLYEREIPSVFSYGKRGNFQMYAFVNWSEKETALTLSLSKEMYGKGYFGKVDYPKTDKFMITLPPHASQIVYFSESKEDFQTLGNSIMPE